jgi:hypothetical protein
MASCHDIPFLNRPLCSEMTRYNMPLTHVVINHNHDRQASGPDSDACSRENYTQLRTYRKHAGSLRIVRYAHSKGQSEHGWRVHVPSLRHDWKDSEGGVRPAGGRMPWRLKEFNRFGPSNNDIKQYSVIRRSCQSLYNSSKSIKSAAVGAWHADVCASDDTRSLLKGRGNCPVQDPGS